MPNVDRETLRQELLDLFEAGFDIPLPEARFTELALRVFAYQFAHNPPYAAYCRRRGVIPDRLADWRDIPAVPTAAFKEVALVAGDPATARAIFRTSGTTRGPERRGQHYVLDPALYHASLVPTFEALVLPDGVRPPMLSLIPSPADAPDSSLSHMVGVLAQRLGGPDSAWFAGQGGFERARLTTILRTHEREARPVCLLGTSIAFADWLEELRAGEERFRLPLGSRIMDTGGYKGSGREVAADDVQAALTELLGIPESHQINEYGMTELFSQYYDARLRDRVRGVTGEPRRKVGAPWLRALVVDPESLAPVPPGQTGILRHVDLANLDSVLAVQTEDLGREVPGGFELLGRTPGAPPRGCSLAADQFLAAARELQV
jgi:hypothetical protein